MAQTLYLSPITMIVQYLTNLGLMAAGGSVSTYVGGSVNTPATTYTDSTGAVGNPNPMTLSPAGRPVAASGASVSFWTLPGVVLKLVVSDAGANPLVSIDNISAINDLTNLTNSLQVLLASPTSSNTAGSGPVAGADLVANAVKSYNVFADLRAANAPLMASGQTLIVEVQGGTAGGDGLGGIFYWVASNSTNDDGRTIIKPNSVASGANGRYVRTQGLGVPIIVVLAADFQVVSNTTPQPAPGLNQNLLSGGTYIVQLRLQLLGIGGTGQGWKVNGNLGSVSGQGAGGGVVSGNGTAAAQVNQVNTAFAQAAISTTNNDVVNVDYIVTVSGLSAFAVQVGQNSSSVNATTLKAGSALIVTRIA